MKDDKSPIIDAILFLLEIIYAIVILAFVCFFGYILLILAILIFDPNSLGSRFG